MILELHTGDTVSGYLHGKHFKNLSHIKIRGFIIKTLYAEGVEDCAYYMIRTMKFETARSKLGMYFEFDIEPKTSRRCRMLLTEKTLPLLEDET